MIIFCSQSVLLLVFTLIFLKDTSVNFCIDAQNQFNLENSSIL